VPGGGSSASSRLPDYTELVSDTGFEEVEHTADWALHVRGGDLVELLRNASTGMYRLAGIVPGEGPQQVHEVDLKAADREGLLVAWLEELLYLAESRGLAMRDVMLEEGPSLAVRARFVLAPIAQIERSIKAVTYHGLAVRESEDGWEATVIFDV
jgi:SHS2 domain-containing protein